METRALFFFKFSFLLFWGGNGNFPCRRSLLPKKCCSPGVVERKRCPTACFWSGSAPAERDILVTSGVTHARMKGKVIASQPVQFLGNKWSLWGPKCYSCPSYQDADTTQCSPQGSHLSAGGGKTKTSCHCCCSGLPWGGSKEKKNPSPVNYFTPPREINPRIFSTYVNISPLFIPHFKASRGLTSRTWSRPLSPPSWNRVELITIWERKNRLKELSEAASFCSYLTNIKHLSPSSRTGFFFSLLPLQ